MAKINFTSQYNEENLSVAASLGVLMCLVVIIVAIKLWWFKHRLSFEHTNSQNGAAGGRSPPVIVPQRNKQRKYKKDKRYSQEISNPVEVHGVFRQKNEDDFEIHRPQELPPIGIRKMSNSISSLILPPERAKRRNQIHSEAFKDLEIANPALTVVSSSEIQDSNIKISMTFEEFRLKQVKPEVPKASNSNEVNEKPVPPLRLNRSSSSFVKEKSPRYLESSQSITIPEFHRVKEKRPTGFSSPTEDLTKIDDSNEPKLFESFKELRPTGYFKYEEIDSDLQDQYERELNNAVTDDNSLKGISNSIQIFRNEHIYSNDLNDSSYVQLNSKNNFNTETCERIELKDVDHKKVDFVDPTKHKTAEIKETSSVAHKKSVCTDFLSAKEVFSKEYYSKDNPTELIQDQPNYKEKVVKTVTAEFDQESETDVIEDNTTSIKRPESSNGFSLRSLSVEEHDVQESNTTITQELENSKEKYISEYISVKEPTKSLEDTQTKKEVCNKYSLAKDETHSEMAPDADLDFLTSTSLQETFDNEFSSSSQFADKIKTTKVNIRQFHNQEFEPQIDKHKEEVNDFINKNNKDKPSISFDVLEIDNQEKITLNQRRPTGFSKNYPEYIELSDPEKCQQDCRSQQTETATIHTKDPELIFSSGTTQSLDDDNIKRRKDEYEEDKKEENLMFNEPTNLTMQEIQPPKVKFEDSGETYFEKYTLNQRRPTRFSGSPNKEIRSDDYSTNEVKFDKSANFGDEQKSSNSDIKQRRPTGYIKKSAEVNNKNSHIQRKPASYNEDISLDNKKSTKHDLKNKDISQNFKASFREGKQSFSDSERRPTGYMDKEEIDRLEKQVSFQLNCGEVDETQIPSASKTSKHRRPTGLIRREDIVNLENQLKCQLNVKKTDIIATENETLTQRRNANFTHKEITKRVDFQIGQYLDEDDKKEFGNDLLKQRRPTGFISKKELKCLETPPSLYEPSIECHDQDFDDNLWREMEINIEQDFSPNIEAEFNKIRHSYELNEADFLEVKDEMQKSPIITSQERESNTQQSPQEININSNEQDLTTTTSILKECKSDEYIEAKPRKSKVTFDFKTNERIIPARKTNEDLKYDLNYHNDHVYDKSAPLIPPQPLQRLSNINYNTAATLSTTVPIAPTISLFGSQISYEDDEEDSWSAIRRHRNFTVESKLSPPSPDFYTPPPKPSYRNPMAQLAIQRAKEVRADVDGFKSRSISDRRPEALKRQKQKSFNLNNVDYEGTEA